MNLSTSIFYKKIYYATTENVISLVREADNNKLFESEASRCCFADINRATVLLLITKLFSSSFLLSLYLTHYLSLPLSHSLSLTLSPNARLN